MQAGGGDHLTVSVEIEQTAVTNHPNTIKPILAIKIVPNGVTQEVWSVTINNPVVGGSYIVTIGQTKNVTDAISMFASSGSFASAFNSYYRSVFGTSISAVLVMYDVAGLVTLVNADSVQNVYTVTTYKLISQASFTNLAIAHATAATFAVTIMQGSPPIDGTFTLQCTKADNTVATTTDLAAQCPTYQV
jgi:hypothetical protein